MTIYHNKILFCVFNKINTANIYNIYNIHIFIFFYQTTIIDHQLILLYDVLYLQKRPHFLSYVKDVFSVAHVLTINEVVLYIMFYFTENVHKLYTHCYKFFDQAPFIKPPGENGTFDKYCFHDGSYQVCLYSECNVNPCTNQTDCKDCEG